MTKVHFHWNFKIIKKFPLYIKIIKFTNNLLLAVPYSYILKPTPLVYNFEISVNISDSAQ